MTFGDKRSLLCVSAGLMILMLALPAEAQVVSFSLRNPQRIRDASHLLRQAKKRIRAGLVDNGFEVRSRGSVRKGYYFKLSMSVEELSDAGDPPSCSILLRLSMIILPEKRMVMTASSNGRANYNRPTKLTLALRRKLRKKALVHAIKSLVGNLRQAVRQVEAKRASLPKGMVLGKRIRGVGGGGGKRSAVRGSKLNGRAPRLKMISAGFVVKKGLPPFEPPPKP